MARIPVVDQEACISCGLSDSTCPGVFRFNADGKSECYDPGGAPEGRPRDGATASRGKVDGIGRASGCRPAAVVLRCPLVKIYGLTGGNIMQGAMGLDQLGPLRLDYHTPIHGLYLGGAATHPGGGVLGVCGRNAARAVLAG